MSASLPHWPEGSAAVLCVTGPHAIPVSTALRAGEQRLVFALGGSRATLATLRESPSAALCLMAEGVAFTAHGRTEVIREPMEVGPLAALELRVEHVQDHLADGRTEMLAPAAWRWRQERSAEADRGVRVELAALAALG
jgi:hypothetical protein